MEVPRALTAGWPFPDMGATSRSSSDRVEIGEVFPEIVDRVRRRGLEIRVEALRVELDELVVEQLRVVIVRGREIEDLVPAGAIRKSARTLDGRFDLVGRDGDELRARLGVERVPLVGSQHEPDERDVTLHSVHDGESVDAAASFRASCQRVPRSVTYRYIDPLTQVWIGAARQIGLRVVRTPDAYATTDGSGTLAVGDDTTLDRDDSLGQMIFHELCHSLVEGEDSFARADWGMDNTGPDHDWREHACLRVQWVLTGRHGLRALFAPTTDFRAFWDQLSGDVLADRTDRSVQAAILGLRRAELPPWGPHLGAALAATARIAGEAARYANDPDVLWRGVAPPPARHPTGLPIREGGGTCSTCAWRFERRGVARCRHTNAKLDDAWTACERYEAALDCQTCGACCRAAYHSVEVQKRDPVIEKQPSFIVDRGTYREIRRDGDRCAALAGGEITGGKTARYHCVIYDDRPRTCRDFTLGSDHCLTARRRVGLSL
jgi:hypothetical protein